MGEESCNSDRDDDRSSVSRCKCCEARYAGNRGGVATGVEVLVGGGSKKEAVAAPKICGALGKSGVSDLSRLLSQRLSLSLRDLGEAGVGQVRRPSVCVG